MKGSVFLVERHFKLTLSLSSYTLLLFLCSIPSWFFGIFLLVLHRSSAYQLLDGMYNLPVDYMLLEQVFYVLLFVSFLMAQEFSSAQSAVL